MKKSILILLAGFLGWNLWASTAAPTTLDAKTGMDKLQAKDVLHLKASSIKTFAPIVFETQKNAKTGETYIQIDHCALFFDFKGADKFPITGQRFAVVPRQLTLAGKPVIREAGPQKNVWFGAKITDSAKMFSSITCGDVKDIDGLVRAFSVANVVLTVQR